MPFHISLSLPSFFCWQARHLFVQICWQCSNPCKSLPQGNLKVSQYFNPVFCCYYSAWFFSVKLFSSLNIRVAREIFCDWGWWQIQNILIHIFIYNWNFHRPKWKSYWFYSILLMISSGFLAARLGYVPARFHNTPCFLSFTKCKDNVPQCCSFCAK